MSTHSDLLKPLRHALHHLYEPSALRLSDLLGLWELSDDTVGTSKLRKRITQEIRALKPALETPQDTELWRSYEILMYRYVQQCSQIEVANQLGVSVRHLRRLEADAIALLADRLGQGDKSSTDLGAKSKTGSPGEEMPGFPSMADEIERLVTSASTGAVLNDIMDGLTKLLEPLAANSHVMLDVTPPTEDIKLACHTVMVRQALLGLGSLAIRRGSGCILRISARATADSALIHVVLEGSLAKSYSEDDMPSLMNARQLIAQCGGSLDLSAPNAVFTAEIRLPMLRNIPILLIDDNPDTYSLLQRYVIGTSYSVAAVTGLEQALASIRDNAPNAILLDIMMPGMDGWEILGRLRTHPLSYSIPIIVLTVLAEDDLAVSLGANAFLHKPISRERFLQTLDAQTGPEGPKRQ